MTTTISSTIMKDDTSTMIEYIDETAVQDPTTNLKRELDCDNFVMNGTCAKILSSKLPAESRANLRPRSSKGDRLPSLVASTLPSHFLLLAHLRQVLDAALFLFLAPLISLAGLLALGDFLVQPLLPWLFSGFQGRLHSNDWVNSLSCGKFAVFGS